MYMSRIHEREEHASEKENAPQSENAPSSSNQRAWNQNAPHLAE
jgi:hypothetical protein